MRLTEKRLKSLVGERIIFTIKEKGRYVMKGGLIYAVEETYNRVHIGTTSKDILHYDFWILGSNDKLDLLTWEKLKKVVSWNKVSEEEYNSLIKEGKIDEEK